MPAPPPTSSPHTAATERGGVPLTAGIARPARQSLNILGATGSVGRSTLDVVSSDPAAFEIVALTAQSNVDALARAAIAHRAKRAVIGDAALYKELKSALAGSSVEATAGAAALIEAAGMPADCVMAAIVGAAGLAPTLAAVRQGRRVALANKECLVAAGELFMAAARAHGTEILPVDSEHSAVFQALAGADPASIDRIILTASGGPFRTWTKDAIARATPEQALKHPNWSMGRKISIDSATLMNKGLEVIEAFHLFQASLDQIHVMVHPQSIIHSMVAYRDGSVMAQLGSPDMRTPIAVALAWPARMPAPVARLDLTTAGGLTFEAPDLDRFPALGLARSALTRGGAAPAILNAANEIAVEAFLNRRIAFPQIAQLVAETLAWGERSGSSVGPRQLSEVLAIDGESRKVAAGLVQSLA
jgi:1-deoxy-D-xylulose-5-phosphate reductoisomerase